MGIFDVLLGNDAADASRNAAADTYAKQQAATQKMLGYGDQYATNFQTLSKNYDPLVQQAGTFSTAANDALSKLMADPSSVRQLPGYEFAMETGLDALDRRAASRGMLASGNTTQDTLKFSQGLADQTYGQQFDRYANLQRSGFDQNLAATTAQTGTVAQGYTGQLGAQTAAFGGDMASAGTIGMGDVAAANAKSSGIQNLLNTGLKLGGMVLGGGGSSVGSFLGGSTAAPWKPSNAWYNN